MDVPGSEVGVEESNGGRPRERQLKNRSARLHRQRNAVADALVRPGLVRVDRNGLREARRAAVHRADGGADEPVVEDSVGPANGRLSIAADVPGKSEARSEVVPVVLVPGIVPGHLEIGDLRDAVHLVDLVEGAHEAVPLFGNAEKLPAQAQVQRQVPRDSPIVLEDEALLPDNLIPDAWRAGRLEVFEVAVERLGHLVHPPEHRCKGCRRSGVEPT